MLSFIKTSMFITMIVFAVKAMVMTGQNYVSENKESVGSIVKVMKPENLKAAKNFIQSASAPIEVNGQVIDVEGDGSDSVGKLYKVAESEASNMVKTGDTKVYEEQLEKNRSFLEWMMSSGADKSD